MPINMFGFLGRRVFFKAVPRPDYTSNGIPRFVRSSQSNADAGNMLGRQLEDHRKEWREERRLNMIHVEDTLRRLERIEKQWNEEERGRFSDRIEGLLLECEALKVS